jgi:hypothetical protein
MAPRDPLSASPFAFERMDDDEWEEMTFLLAHGEDQRTVRLRAPDGGLDTVLPSAIRPGDGQRGWQAKHYGREIHWVKCEESLDRAVALWNVEWVTFVFPRDLTRGEHVAFHRRLGARHDAVRVDYWGAAEVSARLLEDDRGQRIAQRFFGPADPIGVMERALRAGGEFSTGEHVVERQAAVDEFVQASDPHFSWALFPLERGSPEPPQSPGAILRLHIARGSHVLLADAIPRSSAALAHYGPTVRLVTDDSAEGQEVRRMMAELLAGGGRLLLRDGVKLAIDRMPRPFQDLIKGPVGGEILIKSVAQAPPFYVRLEASTDFGNAALDIDLLPVEPPSDWDIALAGARGGLEMQMLSRWSVNEGMGQTSFTLRFRTGQQGAPLAERADAANVMVAVHGAGSVQISDRSRLRPTVVKTTTRQALDPDVADMARLLSALVEIERFTGLPAPAIPDEIARADIDVLATAADILRAGGETYRLRFVEMRLSVDDRRSNRCQ